MIGRKLLCGVLRLERHFLQFRQVCYTTVAVFAVFRKILSELKTQMIYANALSSPLAFNDSRSIY